MLEFIQVLERVEVRLQWRGGAVACRPWTTGRGYADRPLPPDRLDRVIARG